MKTVRELRAALKAKTDEARTVINDGEKFASVDSEIRSLSEQIERAERVEEIERNVEGRSLTEPGADGAAEWRSLARGEARSMTVAADGGAIVPEQLASQIQNRVSDISPIRSIASVVQVSSADFTIPVNVRGSASRWSGESDDRNSETATPTIRPVKPTFGEVNAFPVVSNHLLDDSAYDVGGFITNNAATDFAEAEGAAFVAGNGTNKPTGLLAVAPEAAGDDTRTAGALQFVETTGTSVMIAEDIVDLVYKLRAGYRANGVFVMNSTTAAVVHKLKDSTGRFLWTDGLAAGQPARLLGYPVVIAEDMPSIADSAFPIAFGDFRAGYTIADRTGVRLIRDEVTKKGFTGFYLSKRVGGIVTDDAAIKLLKVKAA
ncbi:phage major capsid protein [Sulfitobacter dubius]|uniref:phage major capsid protein n=1 Tax=Sulfitobacter dubius TaxID=218673 RepID=UPI0008EF16C2|nr:phage major capsid protein [Sulfitobacter dubius]SFH21072.1 phage major capsid protein, HK97 family [Sulfitobacter dubius]